MPAASDGAASARSTIAAISGNDITLQTADGWRRTITITSSVELTKGGQPVEVSALNVGDQVRFRQTRNDDGTYTVTAVAVVVPSIRGEASAITSSSFKVTTRDGSVWTVTVNGSTAYQYGQGTGSLADVKEGGTVRVSGTVTGDNQITAITVRVAGDRAVGTVTAKTADTITIKRRDGTTTTIHVDADTTYRVRGVEDATLADVAVDMVIGVTGRARADGSIDADVVGAGKLRGFGRGGDGRRGPGGLAGHRLVRVLHAGRPRPRTRPRRARDPHRLGPSPASAPAGTLAMGRRGSRRISHGREYEQPARFRRIRA